MFERSVIYSTAILVALTSVCCVKRVICKTLVLGLWQTTQTHFRPHRMRRLITVCTVCFNIRKLRVKWNSLKFPFRTTFQAFTQRQLTNQCCQCFDCFIFLIFSFWWCMLCYHGLYLSRPHSLYSSIYMRVYGMYNLCNWLSYVRCRMQ